MGARARSTAETSLGMTWTVPAPHLAFDLPMDDGAVIRVRQHGERAAGVRLFLSHGNGFAADGYLPF